MGLYGNKFINLIKESANNNYTYKKIKENDIDNINKFLKYSREILNSTMDMDKKIISKYIKMIYFEDKLIGYIGLRKDTYKKIKYLGISNFMILPEYQRNGLGANVIKDIISKYKSDRDRIWCYVEKDNHNAINFYKKIAKVYMDQTYGKEDNLYYVCLYNKKR